MLRRAADWARCAGLIARRDLGSLWRSRAPSGGLGAFTATLLLLLAFAAGPNVRQAGSLAPAFVWLAVLLSCSLGLGESLRQELEEDAMAGSLLAGVPAGALFCGKAAANSASLTALALMMAPLAVALFAVEAAGAVAAWRSIVTLGLGCVAIAAPGTLVAALAARARGREMLMPLMLLPLMLPVMLAALRALAAAWEGDPMHQWGSWIRLLAAFSCVWWPLCTVLSAHVLEDG